MAFGESYAPSYPNNPPAGAFTSGRPATDYYGGLRSVAPASSTTSTTQAIPQPTGSTSTPIAQGQIIPAGGGNVTAVHPASPDLVAHTAYNDIARGATAFNDLHPEIKTGLTAAFGQDAPSLYEAARAKAVVAPVASHGTISSAPTAKPIATTAPSNLQEPGNRGISVADEGGRQGFGLGQKIGDYLFPPEGAGPGSLAPMGAERPPTPMGNLGLEKPINVAGPYSGARPPVAPAVASAVSRGFPPAPGSFVADPNNPNGARQRDIFDLFSEPNVAEPTFSNRPPPVAPALAPVPARPPAPQLGGTTIVPKNIPPDRYIPDIVRPPDMGTRVRPHIPDEPALGLPEPPPGMPSPPRRPSTVTIQPGDTLWDISERELGDPTRWRQIAAANGISGERAARRLQPGTVLKLPTSNASYPTPNIRPIGGGALRPFGGGGGSNTFKRRVGLR